MDLDIPQRWSPLWKRVSKTQLDKVINTLVKYYRFVTLDEAVAMIARKIPIKPYSMAITFDDGYRNNLTHALPILQKYNIPAIIYLATANIEHRKPFWIDRLDYVLQNTNVNSRSFEIGKTMVKLDSTNRDNFEKTYKSLRVKAKAIERNDYEMLDELNDIAEQLEKECGKKLEDIYEQDDWSCSVSWENIKASMSDNLEYGAHTVDHIRLSYVSKSIASEQIRKSKYVIEKRAGLICNHFCYPNGDYNEDVKNIVKNCGFKSSVSSDYGINKVGGDLYALRRIPLPDSQNDIEILGSVCRLNWIASSVIKAFKS